ncbi:LPS assembly lipoprotein LptE [Helicobacter burdigaliensis]|uniref:LPS assembly lipoprotein LptE n=1 Tax=Helicobacter burdigaliensis TaxID=2315334 RepID=UPI000EF6AEC7|nr:LptE family protein [Helicobacter burdigaliensis]
MIVRLLLLTFLLVGCGYKPISHYTKEALGERIFIELKVDARDPQNSVELKDALSRAIFSQFQSKITDKESADSIIKVKLDSVSFSALAENTTGFATSYRCSVVVEFEYFNKLTQKTRTFLKKGYYNFYLNDSSVITDSARLDAINKALLQAIDGFISQVGVDTQ